MEVVVVDKKDSEKKEKTREIVYISGEITEDSFGKYLQIFHSIWEKQYKDGLFVYIMSDGGAVVYSLALYDLLVHYRETHDKKLTTVAIGECESGATLPFLAGEKRLAYPNTTFFFHDLQYGHGNCSGSELLQINSFIQDSKNKMIKILKEILGESVVEKDLHGLAKDTYLNVTDAIRLGVVHEAIKKDRKNIPYNVE